MRKRILSFFFGVMGVWAAEVGGRPAPMLGAMKAELERSMKEFKKQAQPPYFLSYEVTESDTVTVTGSFGTLAGSRAERRRDLDIDLRVGSFGLDNTRQIRGSMEVLLDRAGPPIQMPVEENEAAIRAVLWYHTDQKFRRALERLSSVRTNLQTKTENTDKAGDFSAAPAEKLIEPLPARRTVDRAAWESKVRKYTAPFRRFGNIYQANATLSQDIETRWFVSSDGAAIQTVEPRYRLSIQAWGKASDGMELPREETFFSSTPEGLPDEAAVLATVNRMIDDLRALKTAPVMEPYVGPAILSGKAAGVFFHEIFGHRIEAQRQKDENEQHTFRNKVGEAILPAWLTVVSDPGRQKYGKTELAGHYRVDNQGVRGQKVTVVENGVLKNWLMSRTPVDGFPQSNGHGRKQPGNAAESRQSNLLVEASKAVSAAELKQMLIAEVKKANLPYGLFFDEIQGGYTNPMRTGLSGFTVIPTMVYRVYPDGREELVRGVDLVGTPLASFSKILAADNTAAVFNGMCGAPSGLIPVAAVAPGLLVGQVEIQKKPKSQETSPILAPPFDDK